MTTQTLESAQYRLVEHYIEKLRRANLGLRDKRHNSNHWFQQVEDDWAQIRSWQRWTATRSQSNRRCAQLCVHFGMDGDEYVSVRQSPTERLLWYRQALQAAQVCDDSERERRLLYLVGTTAYQSGGYEEAEQCSQQLLQAGRAAKDQQAQGEGWFITGNLHSHRTELDAAEAAFHKAVKHFEKGGVEIMAGHAVQGLARIMIFRGNYDAALKYATRYMQIIEAAGRESDYCLAYHTLSNIHTRLGNLQDAKSYAQNAVAIARRLGYLRMIPSNVLMLGYAELALEELDAAWGHFQEVVEAARANSAAFDLTAATYSLGDVCLRRGQYAEALRHYQDALAVAVESRIAAYRSLCAISMAQAHMRLHDSAAAQETLKTGAEVALQIKSDILLAKALIPAMMLWQALGKLEAAAELAGLLTLHTEHGEQKTVEPIAHELEATLGRTVYAAAAGRGQQRKLDEVVKALLAQLPA
ncbi:MAG: hypothetical protein R3E39_29325 [Anaerolineae bacterium]